MTRVQKAMVLGGVLASLLGVHGCSSSSSGVFGQSFNVMGHWSGTVTDNHGVARAVTLTLVDSGSEVVGTVNIVGYSCFSGGNFTGIPTPFPANTSGDNPLTADQENSNQGGITLTLEDVTSSGGVVAVTIVSGGTGYVEPPVVEFAPPPGGGRTAAGVAVIAAGAVTEVVITDPGSGYAIPPLVSFSGGEGSDAIATGVLDTETTTVYDVVTFNMVGSSSKLSGSWTGAWGSSSDCPVGSSGTISISRL